MPIVDSTYKPSIIFRNGFFSTVYSGLIRKIKHNPSKHKRERFTLSDGDFLDIDWDFANSASEKLLILLHGLEGSSDRPYMLGASTLFNKNGYDTLRISFRGCSGEENLKYRSYHSGDTSDLNEIIQHIIKNKPYKHIFLKGFSLGGNVILKYLGENERLPLQIKGAVAISVPCDLKGSAQRLLEFYNKPYAIRFKRHLLKRLRIKQQQFPEAIGIEELNKIKTLIDFDDIYTAKAHGFTDADD